MFRCEDHRAESRLLRHTSPLPGVELRGRKDGGRFLAVPPLAIGKRVHAEVDEHRELIALPLQLSGGRHGPDPLPRQPRACGGQSAAAHELTPGYRRDDPLPRGEPVEPARAALAVATNLSSGVLATTSPTASSAKSSAALKRMQALPISSFLPAALNPFVSFCCSLGSL